MAKDNVAVVMCYQETTNWVATPQAKHADKMVQQKYLRMCLKLSYKV